MAKRNKAHHKQRQFDPRWIVGGAMLLIVALVALMIVTREDSRNSEAANVTLADVFSLPNFDGDDVSLADFRGQYVLVNFWASWCPPCKAEMPDLHAYYEENKDNGFTVLAINTNDEPASALDFIQTNGFTFPVVLDTTASVFDIYKVHAIEQYGGSGLPTSYLIGPGGELLKVWRPGAISRADLERDVTPLLNS